MGTKRKVAIWFLRRRAFHIHVVGCCSFQEVEGEVGRLQPTFCFGDDHLVLHCFGERDASNGVFERVGLTASD